MKFLNKCPIALLLGVYAYAQSTQAPATPGELTYFKFMLTALASPMTTPAMVQVQEKLLTQRFSLNTQELAVIETARQQMIPVLQQAHQATQQITNGKQDLAASDLLSIHAIDATMDGQIASLANTILQLVRPQTAAQLRAVGDLATGHINFAAVAQSARGGN